MALHGAAELRARFRAVGRVWKPVGKGWADETVQLMRPRIPVRTGATRRSVKRGRVTTKKATVVGSYVINFLSAGTKAHTIRPKSKPALVFEDQGRTIFARKVMHPQTRGTRFKSKSAHEAFEETDVLGQVTKLWNDAA